MLKVNRTNNPKVFALQHRRLGEDAVEIGTLYFRDFGKCVFWFHDLPIDGVIKKPGGFYLTYSGNIDELIFIQSKIDDGSISQRINSCLTTFRLKLQQQRNQADTAIDNVWQPTL